MKTPLRNPGKSRRFRVVLIYPRGQCIGGIVGMDMQRYHLFGKLIHELQLLESPGPGEEW